ncbi:adenylate kinase [Candidatus Dojkabacteria bacterium]|nr:adenylate kinase [Candidatus Dojkabacteria bacterium]
MKYVVFGVPGVGKTSVIKGVTEKTAINHIHWGDLSFEIAQEKGFVQDRDEVRRLNLEKQYEVKVAVGERIAEMTNDGKDALIETHAAVKTPQGYMPGFSINTINRVKPDTFIVIEADPEFVFQRRLMDSTRWRKDDTSLSDVEESIRVTRNMAMTNAVLAVGTVVFIENKEGDLDYAVNRIVELIEQGRLKMDHLGAI